MLFDFTSQGLGQKISALVLGVALFISVAIGSIGDLMLRRLATDFVQAKLPSSVAQLDRMINRGEATVQPVKAADGTIVGMVVMRAGTGVVTPASFVPEAPVVQVASTMVLDEGSTLQGMRRMLLMACVLIFASVTFIGMAIGRGFVEPLGKLEKDVDRLAKGDTNVQISATHRKDEIGQLARSAVKIQDTLAEFEKMRNRGLFVGSGQSNLSNFLNSLWADIQRGWAHVKVLFAADKVRIAKAWQDFATGEHKTSGVSSAYRKLADDFKNYVTGAKPSRVG